MAMLVLAGLILSLLIVSFDQLHHVAAFSFHFSGGRLSSRTTASEKPCRQDGALTTCAMKLNGDSEGRSAVLDSGKPFFAETVEPSAKKTPTPPSTPPPIANQKQGHDETRRRVKNIIADADQLLSSINEETRAGNIPEAKEAWFQYIELYPFVSSYTAFAKWAEFEARSPPLARSIYENMKNDLNPLDVKQPWVFKEWASFEERQGDYERAQRVYGLLEEIQAEEQRNSFLMGGNEPTETTSRRQNGSTTNGFAPSGGDTASFGPTSGDDFSTIRNPQQEDTKENEGGGFFGFGKSKKKEPENKKEGGFFGFGSKETKPAQKKEEGGGLFGFGSKKAKSVEKKEESGGLFGFGSKKVAAEPEKSENGLVAPLGTAALLSAISLGILLDVFPDAPSGATNPASPPVEAATESKLAQMAQDVQEKVNKANTDEETRQLAKSLQDEARSKLATIREKVPAGMLTKEEPPAPPISEFDKKYLTPPANPDPSKISLLTPYRPSEEEINKFMAETKPKVTETTEKTKGKPSSMEEMRTDAMTKLDSKLTQLYGEMGAVSKAERDERAIALAVEALELAQQAMQSAKTPPKAMAPNAPAAATVDALSERSSNDVKNDVSTTGSTENAAIPSQKENVEVQSSQAKSAEALQLTETKPSVDVTVPKEAVAPEPKQAQDAITPMAEEQKKTQIVTTESSSPKKDPPSIIGGESMTTQPEAPAVQWTKEITIPMPDATLAPNSPAFLTKNENLGQSKTDQASRAESSAGQAANGEMAMEVTKEKDVRPIAKSEETQLPLASPTLSEQFKVASTPAIPMGDTNAAAVTKKESSVEAQTEPAKAQTEPVKVVTPATAEKVTAAIPDAVGVNKDEASKVLPQPTITHAEAVVATEIPKNEVPAFVARSALSQAAQALTEEKAELALPAKVEVQPENKAADVVAAVTEKESILPENKVILDTVVATEKPTTVEPLLKKGVEQPFPATAKAESEYQPTIEDSQKDETTTTTAASDKEAIPSLAAKSGPPTQNDSPDALLPIQTNQVVAPTEKEGETAESIPSLVAGTDALADINSKVIAEDSSKSFPAGQIEEVARAVIAKSEEKRPEDDDVKLFSSRQDLTDENKAEAMPNDSTQRSPTEANNPPIGLEKVAPMYVESTEQLPDVQTPTTIAQSKENTGAGSSDGAPVVETDEIVVSDKAASDRSQLTPEAEKEPSTLAEAISKNENSPVSSAVASDSEGKLTAEAVPAAGGEEKAPLLVEKLLSGNTPIPIPLPIPMNADKLLQETAPKVTTAPDNAKMLAMAKEVLDLARQAVTESQEKALETPPEPSPPPPPDNSRMLSTAQDVLDLAKEAVTQTRSGMLSTAKQVRELAKETTQLQEQMSSLASARQALEQATEAVRTSREEPSVEFEVQSQTQESESLLAAQGNGARDEIMSGSESSSKSTVPVSMDSAEETISLWLTGPIE